MSVITAKGFQFLLLDNASQVQILVLLYDFLISHLSLNIPSYIIYLAICVIVVFLFTLLL